MEPPGPSLWGMGSQALCAEPRVGTKARAPTSCLLLNLTVQAQQDLGVYKETPSHWKCGHLLLLYFIFF